MGGAANKYNLELYALSPEFFQGAAALVCGVWGVKGGARGKRSKDQTAVGGKTIHEEG